MEYKWAILQHAMFDYRRVLGNMTINQYQHGALKRLGDTSPGMWVSGVINWWHLHWNHPILRNSPHSFGSHDLESNRFMITIWFPGDLWIRSIQRRFSLPSSSTLSTGLSWILWLDGLWPQSSHIPARWIPHSVPLNHLPFGQTWTSWIHIPVELHVYLPTKTFGKIT